MRRTYAYGWSGSRELSFVFDAIVYAAFEPVELERPDASVLQPLALDGANIAPRASPGAASTFRRASKHRDSALVPDFGSRAPPRPKKSIPAAF